MEAYNHGKAPRALAVWVVQAALLQGSHKKGSIDRFQAVWCLIFRLVQLKDGNEDRRIGC
ncbi:hypothetical protein DCC85_01935 [Paenibacillus sp. CAA11]|nr:hypothetical protein DCC85_01935 [Paenibacillus sp. CAA11]